MELIAEWCEKNELILNTTAGKTESMLFGTAKNLRQQSQTLNVTYRDQLIRSVTTYKYLGVEISHSLNMTTNFDNTYKKACGRLRLLRKIRPFLNVKAAKAIYQGMVLPILTYCGLLNLKLSRTQEDKLLSVHHRALDIIKSNPNHELGIKPPNIYNQIRACQLVRKYLDGNVCSNFMSYFETHIHNTMTRNNGYKVILPKIRLEYSRGAFYYMGAKLYNSLPLDTRKTADFNDFDKLLKENF